MEAPAEDEDGPAAEPLSEGNVLGRDEAGLADDTKKLLLRFALNKQSVERSDIIDYVNEKKMERESFSRLPFTIFFFVIYSMAILNHENVTDSGMVQREMRSMLEGTTFEGVNYTSGHKDMGDIDVKEDVYNYLKEAAIPLFINPVSVPREDLHRVLRYNQVIGGVVLQQTRRQAKNCGQEYPNLGPFTSGTKTNPILQNFNCYPWNTESDQCFGPLYSGTVIPGWCNDDRVFQAAGGRRLDFVPDGGGTGGSSKGARSRPTGKQLFSVFLYEYEGLASALQKINDMESNNWIDFNTAWFGMQILVLNPDLAIFVHITMSVYMPPSGAMLPKVDAQSFQPEPYQYMSVIALDGLFCLCVLWLTYSVLREVYRYAKRPGGCSEYIRNFWNFVDLISVLFSYVLGILWLVLLDKLSIVKQAAMKARAAEPLPGQSSSVYPTYVAEMHSELGELSTYLQSWRITLTFYTIIIALKFLESFAAQPRLAVVTNTIARAGTDMIHFGIVMVTVFLSYCVAGMFLFGRRIWDFSSEPWSINTCFLFMIGDFDWQELAWEHPFTAGLWFWSYMVVMQMLMLNMLMAIIMDWYTEVKSAASDFAPVWTQLWEVCTDIFHNKRGETVSNYELLEVLEEMPDGEIDEDKLCRSVGPGMSKEQAARIIAATKEKVDHTLSSGVTMSEAMRMIGWVKITVQKIGWKLEEILQQEQEEQDELAGAMTPRSRQDPDASNPDPVDALGIVAAGPTAYVADAAQRMDAIDQRLHKIENFMQESLQYTTFRGKDLRNRLAVIEDLVRNQRDLVSKDRADLWDEWPAPLGSEMI